MDHPQSDTERRPRWAVVIFVLAAATALAHGWSLDDPLFFDDHWHQHALDRGQWSADFLLDATTLDPENFQPRTWWQQRQVRWRYARPLAVAVMQLVHDATGGRVWPLHLVSLAAHLAGAAMVFAFAWLLTRRRGWAMVAGLLFVVYSHSVFAVGWLAAQNTVLQTVLMLGAMLCYVRASGLKLAPNQRPPAGAPIPPLRYGALAAALGLWIAALLCRENAVVLIALLGALDLSFGRWRHVWRRIGVYAVFAVLTAGYLVWRLGMFHSPLPAIYYHHVTGAGDVPWLTAKLLHYIVSSLWLSPMTIGPSGRVNPWLDRTGDMALMAAIAAIMLGGYAWATRRTRGAWIWPLWIVLAVLPVVPVLATPHSGYMSGVGFAIGMILPAACGATPRVRKWGKFVAIWFLVATTCYMPIYRTLWDGMIAGERYTIAGLAAEPPAAETTDIFFINMPFVNIYMPVCLEEEWGPRAESIRFHPLTYAPDLLRVVQPVAVEQTGRNTLEISLPRQGSRDHLHPDGPWFSGMLGRFLVEGMRTDGPPRTGDKITGEHFTVEVLDADEQGVWRLAFTFARPLNDPSYKFYVQTAQFPAAPLKFADQSPASANRRVPAAVNGPPTTAAAETPRLAYTQQEIATAADRLRDGDYSAGEQLWPALLKPDVPEAIADAAWAALCEVARPVARASAAPEADIFAGPRPTPGDPNAAAAYWWWSTRVDDSILDRLWLKRYQFEPIRQRRDRLFLVLDITAWIIRSDLYMTGPPLPGPDAIIGQE